MSDLTIMVLSEVELMRKKLQKLEKRSIRLENRIHSLRAENTLLLARAVLWKFAARDYRRRLGLMAKISDSWYQGYRRAWRLDEIVQPRHNALDYLIHWFLTGVKRFHSSLRLKYGKAESK